MDLTAAYELTVAGQSVPVGPRLVSLSLEEKRGAEADTLELVLSDHDGRLAIPPEGAVVTLALGWKGRALVNKGRFTVDDVEHAGTPDQLTVRARSGDFTSGFRVRKERSFRQTTLGAVLAQIAGEQGLQAAVAPELAGIAVPVLGQSRLSDSALLAKLGKDHDAVAAVKGGRLIFSPIGRGSTVSGRQLPTVTITREGGDGHRYARAKREAYEGVEAGYHDVKAGKRETVKSDNPAKGPAASDPKDPAGKGVKRIRKTFASREAAERAAKSEASRSARAERTFGLNLARGRPELAPEQRVRVEGFKREIDAQTWLIASASHKLDGGGGLQTSLEMESG